MFCSEAVKKSDRLLKFNEARTRVEDNPWRYELRYVREFTLWTWQLIDKASGAICMEGRPWLIQ